MGIYGKKTGTRVIFEGFIQSGIRKEMLVHKTRAVVASEQ